MILLKYVVQVKKWLFDEVNQVSLNIKIDFHLINTLFVKVVYYLKQVHDHHHQLFQQFKM